MRKTLLFILLLLSTTAFAQDAATSSDPFAAWRYAAKLRIVNPALSDETGLARVSVNLGSQAKPDGADARILDDKGREQAWKLESRSDAGDLVIMFQAVKGVRDYTLIFGNASADMPPYPADLWPTPSAILKDPVVIDDFLPRNAHTHGLWQWVREPSLSGSFSHTSPIVDRTSIHGTSNLSNQKVRNEYRADLRLSDEIVQFVMLDPDDPPTIIGLRLAFERRFNANVWDSKQYLTLTWGKGEGDIRQATTSRSPRGRRGRYSGMGERIIPMGDLPPAGKWRKIGITVEDLLRKAPEVRWQDGDIPDLFGIEFITDGGRAWWDMTALGRVPADVEIIEVARKPDAPPVILTQRLDSFRLQGDGPPLSLLRFFAADDPDASRAWTFADGRTSLDRSPMRLIENVGGVRVSVALRSAAGAETTVAEELPFLRDTKNVPLLKAGIDVVSCPFIARGEGNVLFNLRLEGKLNSATGMELSAVQFDSGDRELDRTSAKVTVWPGDKHPTFRAFSLDFGAEGLARIRFELRLEGRLLAERTVNVYGSKSDLSTLTIRGDRFLDRFDTPVTVRAEGAGPERDVAHPVGLPWRTVIIGRMSVDEPGLDVRLQDALLKAGAKDVDVKSVATDPLPAWSLPARIALAVTADTIPENMETVIIVAASEMMLADVPAETAVDAMAVVIDQLRRLRPKASVMLVIPSSHDGLEDVSRQYALALKTLGIRKRVRMIDLYSRATLTAEDDPDVLITSRLVDGILTRRLPDRMIAELLAGVISEFQRTPSLNSE